MLCQEMPDSSVPVNARNRSVFGNLSAISPCGVGLGRSGLVVVALSVVEQRLDAVRLVLAGATVTEVAARVGVSRQTVHCWLSRCIGATRSSASSAGGRRQLATAGQPRRSPPTPDSC